MLAEILKQRRTELGLTQQIVAEHLNVTRQAISSWETGKSFPDIPTLVKLSDYYQLSLDRMLKGDAAYMQKIEADKRDLTYLKRKLANSMAPFIILLGLLILLELTQHDFKEQLWDWLYLFTRWGVLLYSLWLYWIIRQARRLNLWLSTSFILIFLTLTLRFAEPLFTLPYAGLIYWVLQLTALVGIVISLRYKK